MYMFILHLCRATQYFLPFFFFTDTATTEIYTLSLHDALPICYVAARVGELVGGRQDRLSGCGAQVQRIHADRKSTRLNSSHTVISYAVFCLKKKKKRKKVNRKRATDMDMKCS